MVSSFGITVLESRENKEINLDSDYTKKYTTVLTFTSITSVWISYRVEIWLTINVHHGLADRPRHSFSPVVTCALRLQNKTKMFKLPMSRQIRWCIGLIDLRLPVLSNGLFITCVKFSLQHA